MRTVFVFTLFLISFQLLAVPIAENVLSVTVRQGQVIAIDLSQQATAEGPLEISIFAQPPAGQGSAAVGPGVSVVYTADPVFSGTTTFTYQVTEIDTTQTATGTITVNVIAGEITDVATSADTVQTLPRQIVGKAFLNNCEGFLAVADGDLNAQEQSLKQTCSQLVQTLQASSVDEVRRILQQLAPEEIATQIRTSRNIASRQMKNIGARLAGLRRGAKGLSVDTLSFNVDGKSLPGSVLQQPWSGAMRGGAAGADTGYSPWGLFISGTYSIVERDGTNQENGFEFGTSGLTTGLDYRVDEHFVVGAALGYAATDVTLNQDAGDLTVAGLSFSHYATFYVTPTSYLDYVLTYNKHNYESTRNLDVAELDLQAKALGETDSELLAASMSGGAELFAAGGFTTQFKARADYVDSTVSGYNERGAGAFNLRIDEHQFTSTVAALGLQMTYAINTGWGVILPQLDLDWEHQFEDDAVAIKGNFINNRFGSTFQFETDQQDADYYTVGLGFSTISPGGNAFFIRYETSVDRQNYSEHHMAIGGRLEW